MAASRINAPLDAAGHMAKNRSHMARAAVPSRRPTGRGSGAPPKAVARFRRFLYRGQPGPHSYVVLLGLDTFDAPALLRAVKKGFLFRSLEQFQHNTSLPLDRLMDLIDIPRRTLTRRKREGRFLPDESDRLLRASRLFGRTLALFEGDRDAATEWLTTAQPALGGSRPIDLAKTDVGSREVETLIGRLEHGVFA
jgi:putative toxin-antitoxin system antitoxin component (TIGR02293 family)